MNKFDFKSLYERLKLLRTHIFIIVILLVVQFFSRNIWKIYYSEFQKPYLLKYGASLCQFYTPILPNHLPQECDIVLIENNDNVIEETFYAHQGEILVKVFSQNGIYLNETSTMLGNIATLIMPLIGFAGLGVRTLHKVVRTGTFSTWNLHKHPDDDFERILLMYSLPLFLSSFFFH